MTERVFTAQQSAAIVADGNRLLVANAGTGKTTTVVTKIRWLLGEDVGIDEATGLPIPRCERPCRLSEIAAITFTEKAAYDLKRKLREELARSPRAAELQWEIESATLGTIHSFCGELLRENALRMGIDPTFTVLDEEEARIQQELMIRDIVLERVHAADNDVAELVRTYRLRALSEWGKGTIDHVRAAFRDVRWHAERYAAWCRDGELDMDTLTGISGNAVDARDALTYGRSRALVRMAHLMQERWTEFERTENVRDFDSLILSARALLTGPDAGQALSNIRRRYRILIIDEFQDTDGAQRDIAYAIGRHVDRPQLFFVGDAKQSIYRFRGADVTIWEEVAGDLDVLPLSRNFRSEPAIVDMVNAVCGAAITATASELSAHDIPAVAYADLEPARARRVGAVEWIVASDRGRLESEAANLAERIRELVESGTQIVDTETRESRACAYRDIVVLYRARSNLKHFKRALRAWDIPFVEHSPAGLAERQEIADQLNLLRLLDNPADDLRALSYLRSPFVGLRDEVLARMRLDCGSGSYLHQAERFLEADFWFAAPEHARLHVIEEDALRRGLALLGRARELANRLPMDELLTWFLDESGYRNHLLLLDGSREALANISAFIQLLESHRSQTIGRFLELWDSRDDNKPELPQGQLYSAHDDVVTLSTIHAAKGLEWPVVFLIDVASQLTDRAWGNYWHDRKFGPTLCPSGKERGPRAERIWARNRVQELAEQARLLYVSSTRARDRVIIISPRAVKLSHAQWLLDGIEQCEVRSELDDPVAPARERRSIELSWLDRTFDSPALEPAIVAPPHRFMTSATELMTRAHDPDVWEKLYIHGVEPVWLFAPQRKRGDLPERIRGDLIHATLERITPEALIAQVLEETIGELDAPELELVLAPGSEQRRAIEDEIARVVASDEWKWYVDGEHYRELPFMHLADARQWIVGAFDLYRPDGWVIDFKTHQVTRERVAQTAEQYRLQMDVYRAAAGIVAPVRTQLHFTHPGMVLELSE